MEGRKHPGFSSVICGNNQYFYKDNVAVGRHSEPETSRKVAFAGQLQANCQQKEPSFLFETLRNEVTDLRDIERIRYATQVESFNLEENVSSIPDDKNLIYMEKSYVSSNLDSERAIDTADRNYTNMDQKIIPTINTVSPVNSENIWDGLIKFNASTSVPAVFFFKSGEKVQDFKWPNHVEIKGKVRMHAFEKFIQELPRSRNRALMVISLCWKPESCRTGLAALMEIARSYRESEKVGFAKIFPGIDLYVCPLSNIIITILAKYGFYKGVATVEDNQDSLIGCIVWRRNQLSVNTVSKSTEETKILTQEQSLDATGLIIKKMNSPTMESCEFEKKQVIPSDKKQKTAMEAVAQTDALSMITEKKTAMSINSTNAEMATSIPYNFSLVTSQQITSERTFPNMLLEKLKPGDTIPITQGSLTNEEVTVSDSLAQFVSPFQMAPASKRVNFGFSTAAGPRPLIPIDSSNFQFRPQVDQNTDFNVASSFASSFRAMQPVLPGPPSLPCELLHMLSQSNKNVARVIDGVILQHGTHIMNHRTEREPTNVLEKRKFSASSINDEKDDNDDDLPEFDFPAVCGELEAPKNRVSGCFPNAPPINCKISFKASSRESNPTPVTSTDSFQALQQNPRPSSFPKKLHYPAEGLPLAKSFKNIISEKTHSTDNHRLLHQKKAEELGSNQNHGFGFKHKSFWDDDDDDMPEWCPPVLDLPENPLPNAGMSGRSFPQISQPGLLGPRPIVDTPVGRPEQTRSAGKLSQFSKSPKPALGPHNQDSYSSHADEFNRRPPSYAADRRPRRR